MLLPLLLAVAAHASPPPQDPTRLLEPGHPWTFMLSQASGESEGFRVVVPPDATCMRVWTEDATDDVSLELTTESEDFGSLWAQGPDVWLDEDILLSVASSTPLVPGTWTVYVAPADASNSDSMGAVLRGSLHVAFPRPPTGTLRPGEILEVELERESGLRAILHLPDDFKPERRSRWRVEALCTSADIDLVVGPRSMPNTLDYPYSMGAGPSGYEVASFEGRQAKSLAVHVLAYPEAEQAERLAVRVRLTPLESEPEPASLLAPVELPHAGSETGLARALASSVAVFGSLGSGSGSLISPTGLVLTNAHVVVSRPAERPPAARKAARSAGTRPRFFAGFQRDPRLEVAPEVELELLAYREDLDLALLCVAGSLDGRPLEVAGLPTAPLGDSRSVHIGDALHALGYPMTGGPASMVSVTLTEGICAGFAREGALTLIKTDAGVHSGVSGGALFDADWQLVGVPSSSITDDNLAGGIGFAFPSEAIPPDWLELAQRDSLTLVRAALEGQLAGAAPPLEGTSIIAWAMLRSDVERLRLAASAPGELEALEQRIAAQGLVAFPPLLAGLQGLDLERPEDRRAAGPLRRCLDRLLRGHGPHWRTPTEPNHGLDSEQLTQAVRTDRKGVELLARQLQTIRTMPERWIQLVGLDEPGSEAALVDFRQLLDSITARNQAHPSR